MNRDCLDIGTIQSYLDCELGQEAALRAASHIADCEGCAILVFRAEEESAFVFSALDREFETLVPTQRLWTNISSSIDLEKSHASRWAKCRTFLFTALTNPSFAAAAGLIIVVGVAILVSTNGVNEVATTLDRPLPAVSTASSDPLPQRQNNAGDVAADPIETESEFASNVPSRRPVAVRAVAVRRPVTRNESTVTYLPGEENYVVTIASLSGVVERQKDGLLRPSERVSFERDLAVVDQAIESMKAEVARNPRNEAAKKILYSSYQNKIDLLNSVSQREELMASLK